MISFEVGAREFSGGFWPVIWLVTKKGVRTEVWQAGIKDESTRCYTREEAEARGHAHLAERLKALFEHRSMQP